MPPTHLRRRLTSWLVKRYVARVRQQGIDASTLALVPEAVLTHFRRDGLHPVCSQADADSSPPISRVSLPFGRDAWLVTGYHEVKEVLRTPDAFSNDFTSLAAGTRAVPDQNPGGLGFSDPPVHTRLRRLLTPEFTARRLQRLLPRIESIVEQQLDVMASTPGPVDLLQTFALPVPSLTICELLGVPYKDHHEFQQRSMERFDLFDGIQSSMGAMSDSSSYLMGLVREQRASPGDGLLGAIIESCGDEIDDSELAGLADGILTGGLETSASMLALGALVLLEDPSAFRLVHDDDHAVGAFTEELLRFLSVVQMAFPRIALRDVRVAGETIGEGDIVLCSLLRANRHEFLAHGVREFDPRRAKTPHLAFGYGAHHCIGAELARMELRTAYPALVRRFPAMRLAVRSDELSFRKLSIVYGVDSLPVLLN